jgi:hypothetical protein
MFNKILKYESLLEINYELFFFLGYYYQQIIPSLINIFLMTL